jgi:cobalt-precorrin-7 (C5)-methyltransferase
MALTPCVTIVGCGPGAAALLTDEARAAVHAAPLIAGSQRLLDLFPDHPGRKVALDGHYAAAPDWIASWTSESPVAVLVSGDPGVCSLAALVLRRLGRERCRVIPGISSVQIAFARLGLPWFGARMLSAHAGRLTCELAELATCERIVVLGGNERTRRDILELVHALLPTHRAFWCRGLSLPEEEVRELDAMGLAEDKVTGLGLLVLAKRALFTKE